MLFDDKLSDIIKTLESDGVLLHPTDTVWGLGCSAMSEKGINKIYDIKQRKKSQPLLMLVDSIKMLKKYVPHIHPRIETLLIFHNKPLTVVYPDVQRLPEFALASDKSAAIRVIYDPYCARIVSLLGCPLMSTSANISGEPTPTYLENVADRIIQGVDFVARHKQNVELSGSASVMISYDAEGELNFLRR